jgi:hypothetical protein
MARKPKEIRGIKFRPDRGTWEAQYKADGSRVRKNFSDHEFAVVWLETAKGLRHKEGVASLPSSAAEPLLTLAEKKELKRTSSQRSAAGRTLRPVPCSYPEPEQPRTSEGPAKSPAANRSHQGCVWRPPYSFIGTPRNQGLADLSRSGRCNTQSVQIHAVCGLHLRERPEARGIQPLP